MNFTKIFLSSGMLMMSAVLLAQGGAPPAVPIDGGLSLALLATGGAIGIRALRKKKENQ